MVSAIHAAKERGLQLAHLWRPDSPVGNELLFDDERTGARTCEFETLFEPIPFFPSFQLQDVSVRLLYEEQNPYFHRDLNVVDEVAYAFAKFQYHGPITEEHLADVDALLVLTSLNFPVSPAQKVELYKRHFKPREHYLEELKTKAECLDGKWLAVHLRTQVREAFGIPEWKLEDVVRETEKVLAHASFDRIVVFSDSPEIRHEFGLQRFGDLPVCSIEWGGERGFEAMFLDFLAISKAAFVISSGVSSFSYEASLFGGGVPFFDLCRGLLLPTPTPS